MPYRIKKSNKLGLPPGVSSYSGDISDTRIEIELISYQFRNVIDEIYQEKVPISKLGERLRSLPDQGTTWIDIQGIHNEEMMETVADHFGLHPVLTEDLLSPLQRPKLDIYEDHLVIFLRRSLDDFTTIDLETDQIAILLGKNYVLSFNELDDNKFLRVKNMVNDHASLFTLHRNDFLAYILFDFVVDTYFLEAEKIDEEIERLEDLIIHHEFDRITEKINSLKKRNLGLRKIITPLREFPSRLRKLDNGLMAETTKPFLTDLEDHIYQLIEMVETNRDLILNLKESYVSEMSTRMNEVMMTLTVVSTILLPLTFITSLYGMNFEYMPELMWRYSYFVVWGVMVTIALVLTGLFKRRKWL